MICNLQNNKINHSGGFFYEIYFVIAWNTTDFIVRFATFLHILRTVTVYIKPWIHWSEDRGNN